VIFRTPWLIRTGTVRRVWFAIRTAVVIFKINLTPIPSLTLTNKGLIRGRPFNTTGVGQTFLNDEKNFRIYHGILSHEGVCYSENEDEIYKQKYAYFTLRHITEAVR
jgi:hypothetical protein